jgi:hypothetical protein
MMSDAGNDDAGETGHTWNSAVIQPEFSRSFDFS